jgi:hypothetical protein
MIYWGLGDLGTRGIAPNFWLNFCKERLEGLVLFVTKVGEYYFSVDRRIRFVFVADQFSIIISLGIS